MTSENFIQMILDSWNSSNKIEISN